MAGGCQGGRSPFWGVPPGGSLPNNCVLFPHDKVKNSLLIIENISNLLYCPDCDDCLILNMKNIDKTNVKEEHICCKDLNGNGS